MVSLASPCFAIDDITLDDVPTLKEQVEKDSISLEVQEKALNAGIFKNIRSVGGFIFGYTGVNNGSTDNNFNMPVTELGILADLPDGWNLHWTYNFSRFFRIKGHFWLNGFIYKQINDNSKVYVGRYRMPVGFDGALSPYNLAFASRSMMGRTIANTRGFGARIVTDKKYAKYDLGVYNGARERRLNVDGNLDFSGWVNFKPLANIEDAGELILGTGVTAGKYRFSYATYGAYASYNYKKLKLEGEYAYSDGYNALKFSENLVDSHYYSVYYDLTDKLKILARYDIFDPNKYIVGDDIKERTIGFLYSPKKNYLNFYLNFVVSDNPSKEQSKKIVFSTHITPF